MAKQFRDIISADFVTGKFTTLRVTDVVVEFPRPHKIYYEGCISPITVDAEDFNQLCEGRIVELHHGEVAIRWV